MKPAISGGGARSGVSRTADKVGDWRRRRRRIGISGRRLRRWVETEWMGGPLDRMGLISASWAVLFVPRCAWPMFGGPSGP